MSADPRDAPWSEAEILHVASHYPELIGQPPGGQRYVTISRREALAWEARYPTLIKRPEQAAVPAGADPVLAARYPNSPSMFSGT